MPGKNKKQHRSKPLSGKVVLVTRAKRQAEGLSQLLRGQGARVIEIPLIEIRPPQSWRKLDSALENLAKYRWLILTSVNGVEALFARLRKLRLPVSSLRHLNIAAIGPATRAAIEAKGLRVAVTPKQYVAEAVVRALQGQVMGERVLLVRAAVARDVIPRELRKAGAQVDVAPAYETRLPAASGEKLLRSLTGASAPNVITFTSSSTVHNFARLAWRLLQAGHLDGTALASVGPITSATLREHGMKPAIEAREYTMDGLAEAMTRWAEKRKRNPREK